MMEALLLRLACRRGTRQGETQIERPVLSDQRHHRDLPQHVGMGIKWDTVGISLDPKLSTEFLRAAARLDKLASSVDGQMSMSMVRGRCRGDEPPCRR